MAHCGAGDVSAGAGAGCAAGWSCGWSMIRNNGSRFSEKIMLCQRARVPDDQIQIDRAPTIETWFPGGPLSKKVNQEIRRHFPAIVRPCFVRRPAACCDREGKTGARWCALAWERIGAWVATKMTVRSLVGGAVLFAAARFAARRGGRSRSAACKGRPAGGARRLCPGARSIAGPASISAAKPAPASVALPGAILSPEQTTLSTAVPAFSAAARVGANYQLNMLVLGVEGDFSWTGLRGNGTNFARRHHRDQHELDVDRHRARRRRVRSPADLRQGRRRLRPRSEQLYRSCREQREQRLHAHRLDRRRRARIRHHPELVGQDRIRLSQLRLAGVEFHDADDADDIRVGAQA